MAFKLFSDNTGHFFFFYARYNQHKFHFGGGGGRGVGSPSELILLAFRLPPLPFQLANFLFIIIIIFHERQLTYKESKREYREYPTGDLIFLHTRTSIYAALNV